MRTVVGAVVVPDGVATVTLQPVRLISPPAPVDPRRFGTSTASVHDNIAAYRFTVPYVHDPHQKSLVYAVTVLARATWRDRHGTVIAPRVVASAAGGCGVISVRRRVRGGRIPAS
jgi:hypothetical protein